MWVDPTLHNAHSPAKSSIIHCHWSGEKTFWHVNITQETARQCISRASFLYLLLCLQFLHEHERNGGLLFVWKKVILKMMGMVVVTGPYIIFSQSICGTSSPAHPLLPASSSAGVTSSDTPQPTDCDITSEILPVVSSSSQQDDLIQSTQPAAELMTNSNASQSSPTATRSISPPPTALFIMFGRTRWRLLNGLFLLTVGTAKSVSAYQNASTASNSLDWVIGIVWALM